MKKTLVTGVLAAALIATGGTGMYIASAKENPVNPLNFIKQQGVDVNQMTEMMETGNFEDMQKFMDDQNVNFGQMKPYMKEMHPDLSDQELEEFYKGMHGIGGAANSKNFQGMMGNL
ncbi:hypothetical protein [Bacillus sp. V33-4]|uniref:hypothetical protein n=1 Tax=Bacillus sp. V33-4 TaxID=2054169 RepID=UPI000C76B001|nr:hypothetical protein [Bacillus sp. V33-4]PLR83676.1 hypothetical protein CVD23_13670 [Bacillus sp. V33-4]